MPEQAAVARSLVWKSHQKVRTAIPVDVDNLKWLGPGAPAITVTEFEAGILKVLPCRLSICWQASQHAHRGTLQFVCRGREVGLRLTGHSKRQFQAQPRLTYVGIVQKKLPYSGDRCARILVLERIGLSTGLLQSLHPVSDGQTRARLFVGLDGPRRGGGEKEKPDRRDLPHGTLHGLGPNPIGGGAISAIVGRGVS